MTPARTLLAAVVIAAATVPLTATPASAHTGSYCGHSSTTHYFPWTHTVTWKRSYTTPDGRTHKHLVQRTGLFTQTAGEWVTCTIPALAPRR